MERERFVFISYASKEMEVAARVCKFLEDNGIRCWIAPRNVSAGSNDASRTRRLHFLIALTICVA